MVWSQTTPAARRSPCFHHTITVPSQALEHPLPLQQPTQQHLPKDSSPESQTGIHASLTAHIAATHTQKAPSDQLSPSSDSQCKPCTATQGRDKGDTAGRDSTRAPCSHMTVTLMSLTQYRHGPREQRSAAVTISSVGSSLWLGMSPLSPDSSF